MNHSIKQSLVTLVVLVLLCAGVTLWYRQLPLRKQQFIRNLLRQAPDLPARYMV